MKTTKKIRKIDWQRRGLRALRARTSQADDKQLSLELFDDETLARGAHPMKLAPISKPRQKLESDGETKVGKRPKAQG